MGEFLSAPDTPRRVAIYIRVSKEEQYVDGYGFDAQRDRLLKHVNGREDYIHRPDWFFSDVHTGAELNRDGLKDLREAVKRKEFDAVLVWRIDRLSRSLKHLLVLFEEFEDSDVGLVSLQENLDFKGPIGRLIFQVFGAIAQFERELIKGRTKMGRIASANQGNFIGSNIPYGYRPLPNPSGRGKKLEVIEEERQWVQKIFEWYVYEGQGFGQIASRLNQYKVVRGLHGKSKGQLKRWSDEAVDAIIKNSIYRGEHIANRKDDDGKDLHPDEWTIVHFPPCISDLLFLQAVLILEKRREQGAGKRKHLLSGKIIDVTCAPPRSFVGVGRTKGGFSYRRKKYEDKDLGRVANFEFPAKPLDDLVIEKIQMALKDPELFIEEYLSKQLRESNKSDEFSKALNSLRKRQVEKEMAMERLFSGYESGLYGEENFATRLSKVERELGEIADEIQGIENKLFIISSKDVEIAKLREASKQVRYRLGELDDLQKQLLVDLFIQGVEITREKKDGKTRVTADIRFRFNPERLAEELERVSTQKRLAQAQKSESDSQKKDSGRSGGT